MPSTLAVMHGSSYTGDGQDALLRLADVYDTRLRGRRQLTGMIHVWV